MLSLKKYLGWIFRGFRCFQRRVECREFDICMCAVNWSLSLQKQQAANGTRSRSGFSARPNAVHNITYPRASAIAERTAMSTSSAIIARSASAPSSRVSGHAILSVGIEQGSPEHRGILRSQSSRPCRGRPHTHLQYSTSPARSFCPESISELIYRSSCTRWVPPVTVSVNDMHQQRDADL